MKNLIKKLEALGEFIKASRLEKLISGATEEMTYRGKPITEKEALYLVKKNFFALQDIENPTEELKLEVVKENGRAIEYIENPSEEVQLEAVKQSGWSIRFIKNPTEELKLVAVKQSGETIRFIKNPSVEIQMVAVKKNVFAIQWIKNPSIELQLIAVKQNGFTIEFIENPSVEVQLEAVKENGFSIQHIENPTEKVQLEAVKRNGEAIEYIKNPTEELKLIAVKRNGWAIQYIKNTSEEVQLEAVKQDGWSIKYIKNASVKVQLEAVKQNGLIIQYIENPSEELKLIAVKQDGWAIEFIKNPSVEVQMEAVKQKGSAIEFIENPSEEVQMEAVKENGNAIELIKNPSVEVRKYLEKKTQIKDYNPEYEFNDNDLFLIKRHMAKKGLTSISIRILKKEFVITPVIQNLISKLNGKDLTAKILKEYDESLEEKEKTDLKELLKHSKLLKSTWKSTSQRIFKNKNHVFLLGTLMGYVNNKKLQEYSKNTYHPSVHNYLTLIWIRYTKFKDYIWIDEIQSDLDKVASINTKNLYSLILKKFIQYNSSKGNKTFYYPTYNIKRKFYKADPPASIYKDLPKKFRFKLLDQVDFDTKKQLLNKEKVWKLEAKLK